MPEPVTQPDDSGGQNAKQYTNTPQGNAARIRREFEAFDKWSKDWREREAPETVRLFLDKRAANDQGEKVNLFTSNIQIQEALLYGETPKASVERRWSDFEDPVARVAGTILGRLLNLDIARPSDGYAASLRNALSDMLKPGLGVVRLRYTADFDEEHKDAMEGEPVVDDAGQPVLDDAGQPKMRGAAPAVDREFKTKEDVVSEYFHWSRVKWAVSRTWLDVTWFAFCYELTREQCISKFGQKVGGRIPVRKPEKSKGREGDTDAMGSDPWSRAEVWEVWDKERKCLWFWAAGMERVLTPVGIQANASGSVPDPLELEGFWPLPAPLVANTTTDAYLPRSDYALAQDHYRAVNHLKGRISTLRKALKVVGVYDKNSDGVARMLNEGQDNQMIPVTQWAMFAEKGGIVGAVDFFPVEMVAKVLDSLGVQLQQEKALLYEVVGLGDIMRGEQRAGETATTSALEAKFGSIRMKRRQSEFARFASELQAIKAEIICKHFDTQTIVDRSNVMRTPDRAMVEQELQAQQMAEMAEAQGLPAQPPQDGPLALLRSELRGFRVEVKPESVSLTDHNAMKQERVEVLGAIGEFLQVAGPMMQQMPAAAPGLLSLLSWLVSGVKGGAEVEGQMQQMIATVQRAMQNPQPKPPDPKLEAEKVKAGAEVTKAKLGVVKTLVDTHSHAQRASLDMQKAHVEHALSMQQAEHQMQQDVLNQAAATPIPGV